MTEDARLVIHATSISAAALADLLDALVEQDDRVSFADERPSGHLDADPATVALIGATGVAVTEMIKLVVTRYLDARRARTAHPAPVTMVVHLSLGGRVSATVADPIELDKALDQLPSEHEEIARLDLH